MEYLNYFEQVLGLFLVAWFICSLKPLQILSEAAAEKSGAFNHFVYPMISCYWCATLWVIVIGLYAGWHLPKYFLIGLACSLIVKTVINLYELRRINK